MSTAAADVDIPQEVWDRADRALRFWTEHHEELLRKYPEQIVAMKDGEIVAAHATLSALRDDIEGRGLDITRDVSCKFITSAWKTFNF